MKVDDVTHKGWPVLLPDKSATNATHGSRNFLVAVIAYGKPA